MSIDKANFTFAKELFARKMAELRKKFASTSTILTMEEFMQAVPSLTKTNADKYYSPLVSCLIKYGITSKLRIAHFLAQVGHECISFSCMAEAGYLSASKRKAYYLKTYGHRPSIIPNPNGDMSTWFIGRGAIQLTHDYNYKSYTKEVGRNDILTNPSLIETDPQLALDVAGWYWSKWSLNTYADQDNLLTITKKINGGTNGLEAREDRLAQAKRVFGL
jgi:putative chitinase